MYTVKYTGNSNDCPGQRQNQDPNRLYSLLVCVLLLAMAASALVGRSAEERRAGAGWGVMHWGGPGKPARAPGSFQSSASRCD